MKKRVTNEDLAQLIETSARNLEERIEQKFDQRIDDLAAMTQRQFEQQNINIDTLTKNMHERFEKVDQRFEIIENRLDELSGHVNMINYQLFHLDERFVTTSKFEAFVLKNNLA